MKLGTVLLAMALTLHGPSVASAITIGQVDDFEDGTTQAWSHGIFSPNPPSNVASGGPLGAGDNYLRVISTGQPGAGGRMVVFNQAQWTGDYVAAGVTAIQMMAANFGGTTLHLRIAIEGAATQYGSTNAVPLPADGLWHPVTFFLGAAEMSLIGGTATLNQALSAVGTLRIVSQQSGPAWQGDIVAGSLGLDVISASARSGVGQPQGPAVRILATAPNPFTASTRIRYELPREAPVRLEIFDFAGRRVRSLESGGLKHAGVHDAEWDGRDDAGEARPAGIYYYRLAADGTVMTRSMVLIRD